MTMTRAHYPQQRAMSSDPRSARPAVTMFSEDEEVTKKLRGFEEFCPVARCACNMLCTAVKRDCKPCAGIAGAR